MLAVRFCPVERLFDMAGIIGDLAKTYDIEQPKVNRPAAAVRGGATGSQWCGKNES
jgi:hypothetical protein